MAVDNPETSAGLDRQDNPVRTHPTAAHDTLPIPPGHTKHHPALAPGTTLETVDGMSMGKIGHIIDAMRHARYRFQPVRRVNISKKNGKTCPLGITEHGAQPACPPGSQHCCAGLRLSYHLSQSRLPVCMTIEPRTGEIAARWWFSLA